VNSYKEKLSLFVTCGSDLEPLLVEELKELGVESLHEGFRGVYVDEWDWSTVYRINYSSRIASRVLLPLTRFNCYDQQSLYNGAMDIDWTQFIKGRATIAIDANVNHKKLRHSLFAAQIVKDAICDQMRRKTGQRPNVNVQEPDVQLNLFVHNNSAVISFDTSGKPLHKRGYRIEGGEAPLQENLAAALLRIANYSKEDILLDPCCGSGTILIEAALIASETPPGFLRNKWGFMHHPQYDAMEWLKVRSEVDSKRISLDPHRLFGVDINKDMARTARLNLKAAGFQNQVDIQRMDFREYVPSVQPTIMITNPPYGKRLDEEEALRPLYAALGDFMKKNCMKGGHGYIFTGNLELAKEIGLAAQRRYVLSNGGIESRLLEYEIY